MPLENKSLHVQQLSGKWVVEKDDGTTVGEGSTRDDAIALARECAAGGDVSEIAIHSEDGQIERTISC
jgi:hypothetical protein